MDTSFYTCATVIIVLLMLTMTLHVLKYSGFTKRQKSWFILTFVSVMVCAVAEYLVHCGRYDPKFALPLTVVTVVQFSVSPLLAVFFSGALGLHDQAKRAVLFFPFSAAIEIVSAPFGWIFRFDENGYNRGPLFSLYTALYFLALLYLLFSMVLVGRRFRHRDVATITMIMVLLVAGIVPMTFFNIHIAYISIGLASCIGYIYYNGRVQEDIQADLVSNQIKMTRMLHQMISGLANMIESRDTETGEHIIRTGNYVRALAEDARADGVYADEIDDEFIERLQTLAPLHDVGKIAVPDSILKKPGKLTREEFKQMEQHAAAGGKVIRRILKGIADEEYLKFASDIATYHHERWDGGGYPVGRKGDDIPLSARIMAIADVYDALISERCYKKPIPEDEAREIIKNEAGTHFDPALVKVFLDHSEDFKS